ncbi:MAG TPA: hypothetical protein VGL26_01655 [Jatrophihabitans sp.]|jgi:hypothetical protein
MPGYWVDGATALPRTRVTTVCTARDLAQLLNLTAAAPFRSTPDVPGGMDLVFDALDDLLDAAPQLRQRWLEGSWDLLAVALSSATAPQQHGGITVLVAPVTSRLGVAVDTAAARRIVHVALTARLLRSRAHVHQHELRTVLAATGLLTRLNSAPDESPESWFERVARDLGRGLVLAPDHPTVDEDPALWRVELALAESMSAVEYAIALRLCAAALRPRSGGTTYGDPSEAVLVAAAEHLWTSAAAARFTDLIGLPLPR